MESDLVNLKQEQIYLQGEFTQRSDGVTLYPGVATSGGTKDFSPRSPASGSFPRVSLLLLFPHSVRTTQTIPVFFLFARTADLL